MATATMKPPVAVSHLDKHNPYRDTVSPPIPTKKPVCPKYQKGECDGQRQRCPYYHPKDLVGYIQVVA